MVVGYDHGLGQGFDRHRRNDLDIHLCGVDGTLGVLVVAYDAVGVVHVQHDEVLLNLQSVKNHVANEVVRIAGGTYRIVKELFLFEGDVDLAHLEVALNIAELQFELLQVHAVQYDHAGVCGYVVGFHALFLKMMISVGTWECLNTGGNRYASTNSASSEICSFSPW